MDKAVVGLWLLKGSAACYGLVTLYRIYTGSEWYWSTLALPVIVLLGLRRLQNTSWNFFLSTTFFVHFLYWPLVWIMIRLPWKFPIGNIFDHIMLSHMLYLDASICFWVARMIIRWNHPSQPTHSLPATKKWGLTILAVLLLFSSRAEQALWNVFDPRVLDNKHVVSGLSFSPDGKELVVYPFNFVLSVHVWDVETRRFMLQEWDPVGKQMTGSSSPDGNYVARWDAKLFRKHKPGDPVQFDIWEWSARKRVKLYRSLSIERATEPPITGVKWALFSPDSHYLACAVVREKGMIEIWDIDKTSLVKTFATNTPEFLDAVFAYSPDGKYIATQYGLNSLAIWNIETDEADLSFAAENERLISKVKYSPDGKFLAVFQSESPNGGSIYIWDIGARKMAQVLQTGDIERMSYSPDGKHIAIIRRPTARLQIWDIAKKNQFETYAGPMFNWPVKDMAYSPDGKYLAVANGHYIKLYNLQK